MKFEDAHIDDRVTIIISIVKGSGTIVQLYPEDWGGWVTVRMDGSGDVRSFEPAELELEVQHVV